MNIVRRISATQGGEDCADAKCPTLHITDGGEVVIQGYVPASSVVDLINPPNGEGIVVIPDQVFKLLASRYTAVNG